MPRIEIRALYDCGHEARTIAAGDVSVLNVEHGLRKMINHAMVKGGVTFNCRCGRKAGFVRLMVDGKLVNTVDADAFFRSGGKRKELGHG